MSHKGANYYTTTTHEKQHKANTTKTIKGANSYTSEKNTLHILLYVIVMTLTLVSSGLPRLLAQS